MAEPAVAGLAGLFRARSIALVGATERSFWSNIAHANLVSLGFDGAVHLVNRKGGRIYDRTAATSCAAIGTPVDSALLMVPTAAIPDSFADLAEAGIRNAVILTSGFAETGLDGQERQRELAALARAHGVTLLGPNCLGFVNHLDRVPIWTSTLRMAPPGRVAIVSQSGATASYIADFAAQQGVGVGYTISTGNEVDVTVARAIDFVVDDPRIKVIAAFVESARDTDTLIAAAARATATHKAIVVLKVGAGELTAKAAQAHTGSLVGDDGVFTAACHQHGIIRAGSIEEMVATAELISRIEPPRRPNLGIVAISGGICEIASDRAEAAGAHMAEFTPGTLAELAAMMPEFGTANNPLDVTGAAVLDPALFGRALGAVGRDPNVGLATVIFDMPEQPEGIQYEVLRRIGGAIAVSPAPTVVMSTTVKPVTAAMRAVADECRVPFLGCGVEHGFAAIAHAFRWSVRLDRVPGARAAVPLSPGPRPRGERETLDYLGGRGVPVVPTMLVADADAAAEAVARLRRPAACKIASPDILHKSDIGGVILNVEGEQAARDAFRTLIERARRAAPEARIDGVLIAPMRAGGVELFAGVVRDPQWGLALAVGLGGVWVELLGDTSLRLLPATPEDVLEMLGELRTARLLDGYRGAPPVDRAALARVIAAIGDVALGFGPDLVSLEVNPLRASGTEIEALDALAIWADGTMTTEGNGAWAGA
ncbi:acetate--CoA ligase family protein [Sphingomonas profundi]|uniref:acetate--CoA ligase family protein n=1 Tax=Alterirhizorhabdus profundi TaxID=2681549 RepID=UPI0012E7627C|nr:acetate--CoA ligase family protein [Sphingomonas profundi]